MVFFTSQEFIDLIAMILVIGYIFAKIMPKRNIVTRNYDPLKHYNQKNNFIEDLKWGIIVAAPAIVLHELAHKFVAMGFGATATLHAPYPMYAVVILLILLKSPIIFFVGGLVEVLGSLTYLQSALVSVAGPLTNLAIWGVCVYLIKSKSKFSRKNIEVIAMMKKINMFLFIFNMIPIPGFDGFNFLSSIFKYSMGLF
jgi:Zn-dependent protease